MILRIWHFVVGHHYTVVREHIAASPKPPGAVVWWTDAEKVLIFCACGKTVDLEYDRLIPPAERLR